MDSDTFLRDYYQFHQKFITNVQISKDSIVSHNFQIEKISEYKSIFAYTILNRVIFLQFLENQSQILPENLLWNFLEKSKCTGSLYRDWLCPLWFKILTVPIKNRKPEEIPRELIDLPFLNTHLFEPIPLLEQEERKWIYSKIEITEEAKFWQLFFSFLGHYKWDPRESQNISSQLITPKILGEIFERICTHQKGTGSFYTPKPIINFMIKRYSHYCFSFSQEKTPGFSPENKACNIIYELLHSLKICDNSCGSGEYLIGILAFFFEQVDILSKTTQIGAKIENILLKIEKTQLDSLFEKQNIEQSLFSNESILRYYLSTLLLHNTLFGVDIQSEAVQITRYRLWASILPFINLVMCQQLNTFGWTPLPDLHYTIKCGNSLLGFHEFNELESIDLSILEKYPKIKTFICEYQSKQVDIKSENDILKEEFNHLYQELYNLPLKIVNQIQNPMQLFHWIIEFPTVFLRNNPGFDLILGNPPYIRQEKINALFPSLNYKDLLRKLYPLSHSLFDFSMYFILRSLQLTRASGFHTYIITNKWLKTRYGQSIREILRKNTKLWEFIDLSAIDVFPGANVSTVIYLLENRTPNMTDSIIYRFPSNIAKILEGGFEMKQLLLTDPHWTFLNPKEQLIKAYIEQQGHTIKNLGIKIYSGIKTGYNPAFIVPKNVVEKVILDNNSIAPYIKPIIRGKEIYPYHFEWNDAFLIAIPTGFTNLHLNDSKEAESWFKQQYHALYMHFQSTPANKGKGYGLTQREDQGAYWWELRPCDYYSAFDRPKIIWQEISKNGSYAWDTHGIYVLNTCYFMPDVPKYYLLILNSPLMDYYFSLIAADIGDKGTRHTYQYVERIPLKTSANGQLLDTLADYILFISQNNESFDAKTIKIMFKIAKYVVYEHYLRDYFIQDTSYPTNLVLLSELESYLIPIFYDQWFDLFWKEKVHSNLCFQQELFDLQTQIITKINAQIKKIIESDQIHCILDRIGSHEWVKIIEERINSKLKS